MKATSIGRFVRKVVLGQSESRLVEFFRYGFVSVVSLAVDFGGLYALTEFAGLHYLLSAAVSYSAGLVVSYLLSVLWVFPKSRLKSRAAEFSVFVVIGLAGMGLNELLLWLLTDVLLFSYLASRLISAVIGYIWKYVLRKAILFTGAGAKG